jgi:hypothetical protein
MNLKKKYSISINIITISFVLILILIASHLRFYKLTKTYSEYDENFMISLHKGAIENKKVSINLGPINKDINIKLEILHNLEKSILLPLYVAYGSTYSPGQYIILPLILDKNDNYETIVKKNRSIAAFASILTMISLFFLFYRIEKKISLLSALTLCIFGFSINSIMYAHHGGVYSTYGLINIIGLILIYLTIEKKITTYNAITLNTFLLYFSYLNIFFVLLFFYIEVTRKNFKTFFTSFFLNKKKYLILNLIIFIPILVTFLLKNEHDYHRGESLPAVENYFDFFDFFIILMTQLYLSIKSLFSGFIPYNSNIYFLSVFSLLIILIFNCIFRNKNFKEKTLLIACLIYFFQWIVLFCFNKIPLDQTRHILTFFPAILVIFYLSIKSIRINNIIYLAIILLALPFAYSNAKQNIEKNISLYDLKYLEKQDEELILTYDSLQPLLFFEKKNKKVHFTKLEQFKKNYKKLNFPNKFIVVGHHKSFFDKSVETQFKNDFPEIYNDYYIEILIEKKTIENYLYNNYQDAVNNGFYVYKFIKK